MSNCFRMFFNPGWILVLGLIFTGCSKDDTGDGISEGITNINNPQGEDPVSYLGKTITVSFTASAAWEAELELSDKSTQWGRIAAQNNNSAAGDGSVRVVFEKNTKETRTADLYVKLEGRERTLLCSFTQESGETGEISTYLNEEMHKRLKTDYLWNEAYNTVDQEGKLDFDVNYSDFLFTNLTKLGDVNAEDGGVYREYSSLSGQRYIYSYLEEISSPARSAATRASSQMGLGMGPTMASAYTSPDTRCLILGYVYPESPAAKAGLQRGDMILEVNGNKLNPSNYQKYQQELFYTNSGAYTIGYARYRQDGITLDENLMASVTAASYAYNPVIFTGVFQNEDKSINIGYMVLESFEISAQEILSQQLQYFASEGIKDLILDLRFNPGGSVAQSRYLMSSIVGSKNYDKTFAQLKFNDGSEEIWTFGNGNAENPDKLGQGPDLNLSRLYVICSENTGSASEMVINSLKGIDFPVTTYGSRTEGKNVGMVTSQLTYKGRRFEFAPITFYVKNAKGEGDYANGFEPDKVVNNQNSSWTDDIDNYFPYGMADWSLALQGDACVNWIIINIQTGQDPDFSGSTSAVRQARRSVAMQPVPNAPIRLKMGRFGNIVYGPSEE